MRRFKAAKQAKWAGALLFAALAMWLLIPTLWAHGPSGDRPSRCPTPESMQRLSGRLEQTLAAGPGDGLKLVQVRNEGDHVHVILADADGTLEAIWQPAGPNAALNMTTDRRPGVAAQAFLSRLDATMQVEARSWMPCRPADNKPGSPLKAVKSNLESAHVLGVLARPVSFCYAALVLLLQAGFALGLLWTLLAGLWRKQP